MQGDCHPKHGRAHHVITKEKVVVVVVCFELIFVRLEVDVVQSKSSAGSVEIQKVMV